MGTCVLLGFPPILGLRYLVAAMILFASVAPFFSECFRLMRVDTSLSSASTSSSLRGDRDKTGALLKASNLHNSASAGDRSEPIDRSQIAIELVRYHKEGLGTCYIDPAISSTAKIIGADPTAFAFEARNLNNDQLSALWRGDALGRVGNPENLRVSLVISHCEQDLGWLPSFTEGVAIHNTTIISKCGVALNEEDLPTGTKVTRLPNVGRCDHTMAYWMARMTSAPQENDVVVFLKDSLEIQRTHETRSLQDTLRIATVHGFGCFREPHPDLSSLHLTEELGRFHIADHVGKGPVKNSNEGFQSKYDNMASWMEEMNLTSPSPLTPVCYGGMFAVQSKRISSVPRETYLALEKSLSRGNNIAEGHYAERIWAGLFSKPLPSNQAEQIIKYARYLFLFRGSMFGALAHGYSICNFMYSTMYWEALPEKAQEAAKLLGFDEKLWDSDFPVPIYSIHLDDLGANEKAAVAYLGLESYFDAASPSKRPNDADPDWLKFPYPLSCPHKSLSATASGQGQNFNVVLAYHVGMVGERWDAIVKDQLQTISECGLSDMITRCIVSYAGDHDRIEMLMELFRPYSFLRNITPDTLVRAPEMPWEIEAMNAIHSHCASEVEDTPTVVFYLHNKGSSRAKKRYSTRSKSCVEVDWRVEIARHGKTHTYGHSMYWRKYMEYFTIERPELCIDKIIGEGYPACGVNLQDFRILEKNHFSGNIWVASCEYIRTLTPIYRDKIPRSTRGVDLYTLAEMWIGTNWNAYVKGDTIEHTPQRISNSTRIRPYSLHQPVDGWGGSLYSSLILPEDYWVSSPSTLVPPLATNKLPPGNRDYYWEDLPDVAKDAAKLLGYDVSKWNDDEEIPILSRYLEDLSKAELDAVALLRMEDYFNDRCNPTADMDDAG